MADEIYRTLDVVLTPVEIATERERLAKEHLALDGARERLARADEERKEAKAEVEHAQATVEATSRVVATGKRREAVKCGWELENAHTMRLYRLDTGEALEETRKAEKKDTQLGLPGDEEVH